MSIEKYQRELQEAQARLAALEPEEKEAAFTKWVDAGNVSKELKEKLDRWNSLSDEHTAIMKEYIADLKKARLEYYSSLKPRSFLRRLQPTQSDVRSVDEKVDKEHEDALERSREIDKELELLDEAVREVDDLWDLHLDTRERALRAAQRDIAIAKAKVESAKLSDVNPGTHAPELDVQSDLEM